MFERTQALYTALAEALGVEQLSADENGGVQLTVGEDTRIVLFAEDPFTLMMVAPVMALPVGIDHGRVLWLLRRNFYDSPLAPFRVSCDTAGSIVVWGRVPVEGMTGETLVRLVDALASEVDFIREEVEIDDAPDA